MFKRLLAIAFIFVCTSLAWLFLGATIVSRTNSADTRLRGRVQSIWGVAQTQPAPAGLYDVPVATQETIEENGKRRTVESHKMETRSFAPTSNDIAVELTFEPRQKGLLWYSTYRVHFAGDYQIQNSDSAMHNIRFTLPLPAASALYDGLEFRLNDRPATPTISNDSAMIAGTLAPGETAKLHVAYSSQGLDTWSYSFGKNVTAVENFHLRMLTHFRDIDFPDNTLAPSAKHTTPDGWQLDWNYTNLLSGYQISLDMPAKLQPGPLASEISFFAPVSLFFFFFVLLILSATRDIDLHPMAYFFLAAAFFAFHLLLAYLVDHIDIYLAFVIASLVSVALVTTYLRIVVGTQFALREAAIAQFLYLVLFSFAFFFKGFTGLAITIGAILTLFVTMQMTGKIRWQDKFSAAPPPLPVQPKPL